MPDFAVTVGVYEKLHREVRGSQCLGYGTLYRARGLVSFLRTTVLCSEDRRYRFYSDRDVIVVCSLGLCDEFISLGSSSALVS